MLIPCFQLRITKRDISRWGDSTAKLFKGVGMNEYSALRFLHRKLIKHKKEVWNIQNKKYFVGAVVLDRKGNPVSIGFNSYTKTHPYQKLLSDTVKMKGREMQFYLHAEINALIRCNCMPHTLIVARIGVDDKTLGLSKPCPLCQEAIKQFSLKKTYFTNDDGELILLERK